MTQQRVADDVRPASVYYCFAADGTLLYVGSAGDPAGRFTFHRYHSAKEWPHHVETVVVGPKLHRLSAARDLERREIRRLGPACNKHHNPLPRQWSPVLADRRPWGSPPAFVAAESYPNDDLAAWLDEMQARSA